MPLLIICSFPFLNNRTKEINGLNGLMVVIVKTLLSVPSSIRAAVVVNCMLCLLWLLFAP